jgi:IclR family pca regulon transcriptional regulator
VDQELEIGLRSLAVPVHDHLARTPASINVGVQASRMTAAQLETRILPELRVAAREVGMLLSV